MRRMLQGDVEHRSDGAGMPCSVIAVPPVVRQQVVEHVVHAHGAEQAARLVGDRHEIRLYVAR